MILYSKNDDSNAPSTGGYSEPVQLTKDEMRAKIRASLAAREAAESGTSATSSRQQVPVHAASGNSHSRTRQSQGHSTPRSNASREATPNRMTARPRPTRSQVQTTSHETYEEQSQSQSVWYASYDDAYDDIDARNSQMREPRKSETYADDYADNDNYRQQPRSRASRSNAAPQQQRQRSAPRNTPPRQRQPIRERRDPYDDYYNASASTRGIGIDLQRILLIILIILILLIACFYFGGMILYNGKFLPNTYINGVNVAGMTEEEAEETIVNNAQDMGVTFVTRDGEEIMFKGSSFGCETELVDGELDETYAESHATWFAKLFSQSEYTATVSQTYSEDALASLIAAYDWGNTPPTDAEVVQASDGTFYIEPEDDGNMIDTEILSAYTLEQLSLGNNVIDVEESGSYMTAEVTEADLEEVLDTYTKYASTVITFDMTNREELFDPVGTEELDYNTYMDWVTIDSDGNLTLTDKDAAEAWVQTNIADKYDTFCEDGYTRSFESSADGTIDLSLTATSTYGWQCDVEATVDVLEQYLQDAESITTEPEWTQAGFRPTQSDGTTFEEGTYIEVDISEQHLWFYIDGELYMETDVVTGLASDPDRETHTGVFKIRDKVENAVLGTYEVQGYEQPVSYWMPIDYTGIGFHDLSRSAYGGEIYLTNGSHGCINLPLTAAAEIFEACVVGMPVIIVE